MLKFLLLLPKLIIIGEKKKRGRGCSSVMLHRLHVRVGTHRRPGKGGKWRQGGRRQIETGRKGGKWRQGGREANGDREEGRQMEIGRKEGNEDRGVKHGRGMVTNTMPLTGHKIPYVHGYPTYLLLR